MTAVRQTAGAASTHLRNLIATEGGSISVERFMQEALYHPGFGYYARRVGTVGGAGDFSTSVTLHPALGQAIAAWASAHRQEVVVGRRWHLVELGGGTGELAASVLKSLGWWGRLGVRYHLVEVSMPLEAQQRARLGKSGRVQWHRSIQAALEAADGHALIFSNEFADAFPCVQLTWDAASAEWREVRLAWREGQGIVETTAPWTRTLPPAAAQVPLKSGQRVETHLSYHDWWQSWVGLWRVGTMLTIDYGDILPTLYYRQPQGTLRAYHQHRRLTGPEIYWRFGQQDLTADVNFSDLRSWGEALGLENTGLVTQADFLRRWLPAKKLRVRDERLAFLLQPDGAGGAFKVLEQTRRTANGGFQKG